MWCCWFNWAVLNNVLFIALSVRIDFVWKWTQLTKPLLALSPVPGFNLKTSGSDKTGHTVKFKHQHKNKTQQPTYCATDLDQSTFWSVWLSSSFLALCKDYLTFKPGSKQTRGNNSQWLNCQLGLIWWSKCALLEPGQPVVCKNHSFAHNSAWILMTTHIIWFSLC